MLVAQALGLAKPDAVDDAGVVQLVGDDGVVSSQASFEEAGVGVESTWIEDSIIHLMEVSNPALEILVDILCPANEADGRHAETMGVKGVLGCLDDAWVIGESQVVIGAKVEHALSIGIDLHVLGRRDYALYFVGASFLHSVKVGLTHGFQSYAHKTR